MTRSTRSRRHAGRPAMTRVLGLLTISLMALSLAVPAATLGASATKRAALTNISLYSYDCTLGANKGGAHEGSVKFAPDPVVAGRMELTVVVRRANPDTNYLVTFMVNACEETFAGYVPTDSHGNGTASFTMYYGSGATSFWVRLGDIAGGSDDYLASAAVTF
jgi:hypothetical protein